MLVRNKPFQLSGMFVGKARSLPLVEHPKDYKHITIVNDDFIVVSKWCSKLWHHLRAWLTTLAKAKARANETFIVQASLTIITYDYSTGHSGLGPILYNLGSSRPHLQTLDKSGETCHGQTL